MKTLIINTLSLLLIATFCTAQMASVETPKEYKTLKKAVETKEMNTTLKGCPIEAGNTLSMCTIDKIHQLIQDEMEYPEIARIAGLEQKCQVYFDLDTQGKVNKTLVRHCDKAFEQPIVEVLNTLEFEKVFPGQKRIHRVDVNFKLNPF